MSEEVRIVKKLTCLRCGKEWWPRVEEVSSCPRCRSKKWNEPKQTKRGYKTGQEESVWIERNKQKE